MFGAWHYPNATKVTSSSLSLFYQIVGHMQHVLYRGSARSRSDASLNGLWTCRQNRNFTTAIPVGLYQRGQGELICSLAIWYHNSLCPGSISINQVSLLSSSFLADPPTFTLVADTSGGPPETYTWTRDGVEIWENQSIALQRSIRVFQDSLYRSTLSMRGRLPGVYRFTVNNRATSMARSRDFTIEGISLYVNNIIMLEDIHFQVEVQ